MRKLSVAFSLILIGFLITNGVNSSEHSIAVRDANPLSSIIGAILDPILKAISGIINVINGLIRNLQQLIFSTLPNIITGLIQTISQAVQNATSEAIRGALDSILTLIKEEYENLLILIENLKERHNELQRILAEIENAILDVVNSIRIYVQNCLGKIPLQVIKILRQLTADANKCASNTISVIGNELKRINNIVGKVNGLVDQILGKIADCLENDEEEEAVQCLHGVREVIGVSLKEIEDALNVNSTVNDAVAAVHQCLQIVINAANSTLTC